jgi:hypothetical protein
MVFINHSCGPNVGFGGDVVLVAMRDIEAGEELAVVDGSSSGGGLDLGPLSPPERRVAPRLVRVCLCGPCGTVELFTQEVGVTGVPVGLGEHVDQDVEQHDVGSRPPRHMTRCVDVERLDGGVSVLPDRW